MSKTVSTPAGRATPRRKRRNGGFLQAFPWIAPCLALIFGIVLFPAGYMIYNSTREISSYGADRGSVGLENFATIFAMDALPRVILNSVLWVVVVVVATIFASLALAQLLNKAFPGRRIVRMAVIVPWATSVVMTTTVFYYGLDPFYGIINTLLVDLGILDAPYGFTQRPVAALGVAMFVAMFVSLPFSTYTILAGLQAIPADTLEAAKVDGAGASATYFRIILPQLRGAIAVASLINIINVFNNLPILQVLTGSIPGYSADTIMTLTFKILRVNQQIDLASALSVVNFGIVLLIVAAYLKIVKPMKEI